MSEFVDNTNMFTKDAGQANDRHPEDSPPVLFLRSIASWQLPELVSDQSISPILAALPSLQRGAVWKPNQIELLWDSILRGFPIGALVLCRILESQHTRRGIHARYSTSTKFASNNAPQQWNGETPFTHHILDGQQRANAIALGYLDPYRVDCEKGGNTDFETLLWLDLAPGAGRLPKSSTRAHLLRVTTVAHPWGFRIGEDKEPQRLEASAARNAIQSFASWWGTSQVERPRPIHGCPWDADVPIPLAWALESVYRLQIGDNKKSIESREIWQALRSRCEEFIKNNQIRTDSVNLVDPRQLHWAIRAEKCLNSWLNSSNGDIDPDGGLALALMRAQNTRVAILPVPTEVLTQPSRNELTDDIPKESVELIANVEHLFQRLNSSGTELRGDDLAYSMIKAYWPGIEGTINNIKKRPTETQVALLGARLALDKKTDDKMPGSLSVDRLRAIASSSKRKDTSTEVGEIRTVVPETGRLAERLTDKLCIESMFGIHDKSKDPPIATALSTLDRWFLYHEEECPWGLPQVLRSRMADQAPEMFLFLLRLTHHVTSNGLSMPDEKVRKKLLGLATAVHWFGLDRADAVQSLWARARPDKWLDGSVFDEIKLLTALRRLKKSNNSPEQAAIANILTPEELGDYIDLESIQLESIEDWRWWESLVVEKTKPNPPQERWKTFGDFIGILGSKNYNGANGLLLMYAQRKTMELFGYDPSRVGYWESHNVPWDFDHILPQSTFYDVRSERKYAAVCKEWGLTIGNLHLWPFEKNRSRQDQDASGALPIVEDQLKRIFLWDQSKPGKECRLGSFSLTKEDVKGHQDENNSSRQRVYDFVLDARARLIRIYSDWFNELEIQCLLEQRK